MPSHCLKHVGPLSTPSRVAWGRSRGRAPCLIPHGSNPNTRGRPAASGPTAQLMAAGDPQRGLNQARHEGWHVAQSRPPVARAGRLGSPRPPRAWASPAMNIAITQLSSSERDPRAVGLPRSCPRNPCDPAILTVRWAEIGSSEFICPGAQHPR